MTAPTEHRATHAVVLVDDLGSEDVGLMFYTSNAHSDVFSLDLDRAAELGTTLLAAVEELRSSQWEDVWTDHG